MLGIFTGKPQIYINYASEYFEAELPLTTVSSIYKGETLTKEIVLSIAGGFDGWEALKKELIEIDFPFDLPDAPRKGKWKFW
ncbi:hypothetical protein [uncultured Flavobacterium sp.]|uniref:hypothetical protein n=1 Tax=uncultured Flavobacterium sp. TaxID=165435 RepID=UPI0025F47565|nr:hypothetical protein [uncultured Flavobacterium sp.]